MPDTSTISIVLAGGRASRLGGRAKTRLPIGGTSPLARVLAACPAGPHIVVGPAGAVSTKQVRFVVEDPPLTGPVAAVVAGLTQVGPQETGGVLVLAGDMPFLTSAVLRALAVGDPDAVHCLFDGRLQYLCSWWPQAVLRRSIDGLAQVAGASLRQMFATLPAGQPVRVPVDPTVVADLDTPADLERAQRLLGRSLPTNSENHSE